MSHKVGDYVLLKNEERQLDPKFKCPFLEVNALDGDRYMLSHCKINLCTSIVKVASEISEGHIPRELD